jgi:hypothetical protein
MENLKCTVTNCLYNSDELCTAQKIVVYNSGDGFANTSDGTGCKTFKPKSYHSSGMGMGLK